MKVLGKLWFRVTNDVIHDLSAGLWPGAAIAIWMTHGRVKAALPPDAFSSTASAWPPVLLVGVVALVLLIATGTVRLRYRALGIRVEMMPSRNRAAAAKHVVFVTVFVLATVLAIVAMSS